MLDTGWFHTPCPCDVFTRHSTHKSFRTASTSTDLTRRPCGEYGVERPIMDVDGDSDSVCLVARKEPINRDSCPNLSHRSMADTRQLQRYSAIDSTSMGNVPAAVQNIARQQSSCADGSRRVAAVQQSRSHPTMFRATWTPDNTDHVGSCPRLDDNPPLHRLSLMPHYANSLDDASPRPASPQCSDASRRSHSATTTSMLSSVLAAGRQSLFASSSSDDLLCGGCTGRTSPIYWELERPRSRQPVRGVESCGARGGESYGATASGVASYSGVRSIKTDRSPFSGVTSVGSRQSGNMRKSYSDSGHSSPGAKSLSSSPETTSCRHVTESSTDCGRVSRHNYLMLQRNADDSRKSAPEHSRSLSSPLDVFSAIWRSGRRSNSTEQIGGAQKKQNIPSSSADKQHRCQTPPRIRSPTNDVVTCEVIADI